MDEPIPTDPNLLQDREEIRRAAPRDAELDALFERVAEETVDREPGLLDRLREMPTRWRILLVVALAVPGAGAMLAAMGIRPDLSPGGAVRYLSTLSILVATVSLAVALSLRGPHRRPVGRWAWAFTIAALLLPVLLAFLPSLWTGETPSVTGLAGPGLACLGLGLATAAMVGGLVRVFQRSQPGTDWHLTAMAAAGGLVAFTTVELHCASNDLLHLVIGHGLIGLVFAVVLWVVVRLRRE
ncbi:MAG: hypothetical protein ACQEXJ_16495 [Myxococcota bacterium]